MFGLSRTFWILWAGALVNRLGGFVMPLLALYLTGPRGLPVQQAGYVVALFGGGTLLSGPIGGYLTDHIGRRRTLIAALVLGAAAMLHLAFARVPGHVAIAAFILGLLGDLYRPAMSAAVADLVPPQDRVRAFGFMYWAVNLGFAVGSALGGAMAEHGWYLLFFGDAATTLLYAGIVFWKIPETQPAAEARRRREPPWAPLKNPPFVAFCALVMLVWLLLLQSFSTVPMDLRSRGLSPAQYGALIALNGVLIVLLQPVVSRIVSRFAHHRVLAFAAILIGIGFGLMALVTTVSGFAATIAVWTLGEISMAGIGPAVAAEAAPPSLRGAYQGLFGASIGVAALLAPVLGAQMLAHYGSRALWGSCALVGFAAGLGQLLLGTLPPSGAAEPLAQDVVDRS